jgi:hypothetical protein
VDGFFTYDDDEPAASEQLLKVGAAGRCRSRFGAGAVVMAAPVKGRQSLNQRQGLGRRAIALEESCEGDIFRREGVIPTKCHLEIVQRKRSTSGLGNGHRIGVESVD